jgi:hypothetical protein
LCAIYTGQYALESGGAMVSLFAETTARETARSMQRFAIQSKHLFRTYILSWRSSAKTFAFPYLPVHC